MNITHTELGDQHTKTTVELEAPSIPFILQALAHSVDPLRRVNYEFSWSCETAEQRQDLVIVIKPYRTT